MRQVFIPETQDAESLGNDNTLLLVVGRGNTLEDLQALKGGSTTGSLVGNHATDGLVEDAGGSAEVEGTATGRVEAGHLAKVGVVLHCIRNSSQYLVVTVYSHSHQLQRCTKEKIRKVVDSMSKVHTVHIHEFSSRHSHKLKRIEMI